MAVWAQSLPPYTGLTITPQLSRSFTPRLFAYKLGAGYFQPPANLPSCVTPSLNQSSAVQEY